MKTEIIVNGLPMQPDTRIIAALVIKLGGRVELTLQEYESAQGLLMVPGGKGFILEANTDPSFTVLDDDIID